MLYTLAHSPQHCDFGALIELVGPDDVLLLMQDGVFAALQGSQALKQLASRDLLVYALCEDLQARGMVAQISHNITTIDYTGFVTLSEKHIQHIAW